MKIYVRTICILLLLLANLGVGVSVLQTVRDTNDVINKPIEVIFEVPGFVPGIAPTPYPLEPCPLECPCNPNYPPPC